MKIEIEKPSDDDRAVIKKQCNDEIGDVYGIAARCPHGFPQVVVLDPVRKNSKSGYSMNALSTLIWLTCPAMKRKIAELEEQGMIKKVEYLLSRDREMETMMTDAHANFYYFRKDIFTKINGNGFSEEMIRVADSGIGGIKDVKTVKCLHLHYAHFKICPKNIVGRAVEGLIREQSYCGCEDSSCRT